VSRPLRIAALGLGFLVLSAIFILRGFPYDLLGQRLAALLAGSSGTQLAFDSLEPRLTIAGPGFEAGGLRVTTATGTRVEIERARLRAAWSTSWLRLAPAVHLHLEAAMGDLDGVLTPGSEPGFDGQLEQVNLARLPTEAAWPGLALTGTADADVEVVLGEAGPQGRVELHARQGSLSTPELPMAIGFEELDGEFVFGDGKLVEVVSLETRGPVFSAQVTGSVGQAPTPAQAPLDLEVNFEVDRNMRPALTSAGLRTGPDGRGQLRIRGTPASPEVR
jgi:type II secretion system protein N